MTNNEKAEEICNFYNKVHFLYVGTHDVFTKEAVNYMLTQMAEYKDEQYSTVYVVTRSEEHADYVEQVFIGKTKAEEYCKQFNSKKDCYHRNINEVKITL